MKGFMVNREYKRAVQKNEKKKSTARPPVKATAAKKERTKPRQFVKEVIAELQKVAWPTRQEVISYSTVVLVAVIVIATLIFFMDRVFAEGVLALFDVQN
jgi:preprotein translocase subunit SecE